jgi:hypothetical protein
MQRAKTGGKVAAEVPSLARGDFLIKVQNS